MRDTEELIQDLVGDPRRPTSVWPNYPIIPTALALVIASFSFQAISGGDCHQFSAPEMLNLWLWIPALGVTIAGSGLALRLTTPTEGGCREAAIVGIGTAMALTKTTWDLSVAAVLKGFGLICIATLPGLWVSFYLLRRGATIHPFQSGLGAGLALGGLGMAVLLLLCDGLAMDDRIVATLVATWTLGLIGGIAGKRLLRW